MTLLRVSDGFPAIFGIAAGPLGSTAMFLEKDYWVTAVLRSLQARAAGEFVLKGGTSLSKGYGIINRFSEDVDILLIPHAGASAHDVEARLHALTAGVAGDLGLPWDPARDPGRGAKASRGDFIRYPGVDPGIGITITPAAVLFETRVGDGDEPSEIATVSPLIAAFGPLADAEHEDLAPFTIRVLEPRRTLLEKLVAVHHAVCTWTPENPPNVDRFGRHYYDIWCLLAHRPTTAKLEDRDRFSLLLGEIERISDRYYDGHTPRPEGGFGDSPAFLPERGTPLRTWLETSYTLSLSLLQAGEQRPRFGDVLKRVAEQHALL